MCFSGGGSKSAPPPAPAPDAPLPSPDVPDIGETRRQETRDNFDGRDAPSYRVNRDGKPSMTPTGPVQM